MCCTEKAFLCLSFSEIYRQKLQQLVAKGELSDEDMKALERLQVMLCVPKQTVEAAHADICGSLFEKVIVAPFSIDIALFSSILCYAADWAVKE